MPTPHTETFWSPLGSITRGPFILRMVILLGLIVGAVAWAGDAPNLVAGLTMIVSLILVIFQAIKRSRDGFGTGWWALPIVVPYVCVAALLVLAVKPSKGVTSTPTP